MRLVLARMVFWLHLAWVVFIIGMIPVIVFWSDLTWTRNAGLRNIHLAAMAFVVTQIIFSFNCPLSTLESYLRGTPEAYRDGCVHAWFKKLTGRNLPPNLFNGFYLFLFGLIVALYFLFPPY